MDASLKTFFADSFGIFFVFGAVLDTPSLRSVIVLINDVLLQISVYGLYTTQLIFIV